MREILTAFFKTGSGTGASLVLGMVALTFKAIIIGPSGIGLYSLLRQLVDVSSRLGTEPDEVSPGVHQLHHELPDLAKPAVLLSGDLEEQGSVPFPDFAQYNAGQSQYCRPQSRRLPTIAPNYRKSGRTRFRWLPQ